jgi:hypothetical protein
MDTSYELLVKEKNKKCVLTLNCSDNKEETAQSEYYLECGFVLHDTVMMNNCSITKQSLVIFNLLSK